MGEPQAGLKGALIAGTNGKGSTAAFLSSILVAGGHHVGTTPSPHLSSYTERIQVDGHPITEAEFALAVDEARPALEAVGERLGKATEFEILITVALRHLGARVDRLVCEVGMGGRLDSTNVLDLGVAVVTNVSLDHQQYLGATVEAIAGEKAGIIKPGNTALTGAWGTALRVVEAAAAAAGTPLWRIGHEIRLDGRSMGWDGSVITVAGPGFEHPSLHVPLLGSHQGANAALAVAAAHALGDATPATVEAGVAATRWPGRLEVAGSAPRVILDGAHNPDALRRVARDVSRLVAGTRLVVLFGAMADKDLDRLLDLVRAMRPAEVVFTEAASARGRAAHPPELAAHWGEGARPVEGASAALEVARELAGPGGVVFACGSLYLIGELRGQLVGA